jgi:hypothetical protein
MGSAMRVQVEFDQSGELRSISGYVVVKMNDGSTGRSGRRARPGHSIVEFEVADVQHERDFDGLRKVMKTYRVTGHPHNPLLEAK